MQRARVRTPSASGGDWGEPANSTFVIEWQDTQPTVVSGRGRLRAQQ